MIEPLMWATAGAGLSALTSSLYVLVRHLRTVTPDPRDPFDRLRGEVAQAQSRLSEAEHALGEARRELDALGRERG